MRKQIPGTPTATPGVVVEFRKMDESDFEGTLVLEKLARIDKVEEFFEAVDSDDPKRAAALMRSASIDDETIAIVLKKMANPYDEH